MFIGRHPAFRDCAMNLRAKLLLGIGLALIFVFTLVAIFSYVSMEESYRTLEHQEVTRATQSAVNTLHNDMENTYSVTRDYSAWTETYLFAQGQNPGWADQNTADDFFGRFNVDYVLLYNSSGQLVFSKGYNFSAQQGEEVPAELIAYISELNSRQPLASAEGTVGILESPSGPRIVTSHPILHDNFDGPAAGSLHLVRKVDSRYLADLASRAGYNVTLVPAREIPAGSPVTGLVALTSSASPVAVIPENEDLVAGYFRIASLQDPAGYYLKITEPRTLYQAGRNTIFLFLASLLGAGIFIIVFVLLFIDKVVLSRLNTIIRTVQNNRESGNHTPAGTGTSQDELAQLALEIDPVFARLTESRIQLMESEERYRTLADSSRDFIFIIDREDRIRYVNPFAAESIGRSQRDLIGQMRSELFPEAESKRQRTNIIRVLANGEPLNIENSLPLPGGEQWHDTLLVPLKDRTNAVTGVMGVSRDITQRKKSGGCPCARARCRYHELFELSGEAVFLIDNETGRLLEANTRCIRDVRVYPCRADEHEEHRPVG